MTCSCAGRRDAPAAGSRRRAIIAWPWRSPCWAPFPARTCGSPNVPRWRSATLGSLPTCVTSGKGKGERGNGDPPRHRDRRSRGVWQELHRRAGRPTARMGAPRLGGTVSGDYTRGVGQPRGNPKGLPDGRGKGERGNVGRTAGRVARGRPAGPPGPRGRRVPPRGGGRGRGAGDPLRAGDQRVSEIAAIPEVRHWVNVQQR